jgi:ribose transport system ATP-binding protein/rhamnose transport system ATP-binding protein
VSVREPFLALAGVRKCFGGVHALRGAELTLSSRGVVHALVGLNGSGKSTLLGILSGQIRPDAGTFCFRGEQVAFAHPVAAIRRGIVMVSQETAIAPDLSICENVLLGHRLQRRLWGISRRASRDRARSVLARLGLDYHPDTLVRDLRPDQRQMVEIARAISMDVQVLILDEATSSLTGDEVDALFTVIRAMKNDGIAIIFVSHRFKEIMDVADEVTVLRDGCSVAFGGIADFPASRLVKEMSGTDLALRHRERRQVGDDRNDALLEVQGLTIAALLDNVTFSVRAGEIVGLAGLVGAGRTELLEAIFGLRRQDHGTITLAGERLDGSQPRRSIAHGIRERCTKSG